MTVDQTLGYLWLNAFLFSECRERTGETYPDGLDVKTQEDFYEQTGYDMLNNIYELIQSYGPRRINLMEFEEGFQQAYEEKQGHPKFARLVDYETCWEMGCELGNLTY